jgi:amino acid permease
MTRNKPPPTAGQAAADTDHGRLRELGYKQELKRHLSVLSNFSISFTVISVLTGVTTLYNTGLAFGGPATMTLGWFVVGAFTMAVGLSMAEICSAFPTSGGLYYWSARLSGDRWAPFAAWITGCEASIGDQRISDNKHYSELVGDFMRTPFVSHVFMLSTLRS